MYIDPLPPSDQFSFEDALQYNIQRQFPSILHVQRPPLSATSPSSSRRKNNDDVLHLKLKLSEMQSELSRTKCKMLKLEQEQRQQRSEAAHRGNIKSKLQNAQTALMELLSAVQPQSENDESEQKEEPIRKLFNFNNISAVKFR